MAEDDDGPRLPDLFPPPRLSDRCAAGHHYPGCLGFYAGWHCTCGCHR